MEFTNPYSLLLLPLILPFIRIGFPSRGYGRQREIAALVVRVIILLSLILALAGLALKERTDSLAVVFLVDVSDSISKAQQQDGYDYIKDALAEMDPEDQAAVILFGDEALVERPMSPGQTLPAFTSIPASNQTDIAEAVRLAAALYPPGAARRMVLLSDGAATTGDAETAAQLAAQSGIDFIAIPIGGTLNGAEVSLLDVETPGTLLQGENFDLKLTIHATEPTTTRVRVVGAGAVLYEGEAELTGGTQTFRVPLSAGEQGFTQYKVLLINEADTFYQNNELAAYTQVVGPPRVLVVAPPAGEELPFVGSVRSDEYSHLIGALETAGFTVDLMTPNLFPFELPLLGKYASIVLVDVPARDLSTRQMETMQSFVRDLGGGLVAVGGPTSFGVGGYFQTPLEATLPVDMEIKDELRRPTLTMVFIIDHSGSMGDDGSGSTKLEIAKEAAARSTEFLFPGDKVGVITFDDTASWVVEITALDDPASVNQKISTIGLGGGTDILAGLQAMANRLPEDDSTVKHVILLTDGGASPQGIPQLVERMFQEYGITLTTVGIGEGAAPFLRDLAQLGGGRYHYTDRPDSIPSIFTEETVLATRSYIIENTFVPQIASSSPIIAGIRETPPLHGYVGTSSKVTAQTILVTDQGDPLLAIWQYGLGKSVAWTSDATARWGTDWVAWDGFASFWAQVVRATINEQTKSPLDIQINQADGKTTLVVDTQTLSNDYLNLYEMNASVVGPDGTIQMVTVPQVAPGKYETEITAPAEGAYLIRVDGRSPEDTSSVGNLAGWVLSYSPEYRTLNTDPQALATLTERIGGTVILDGSTAPIFNHNLITPDASRPLWPALLLLAILLFPFDIAIRRLAIERRDFVRLWQRISQRLFPQAALAPAAPVRSARMEALLRTKQSEASDSPEQKREPLLAEKKKADVYIAPSAKIERPVEKKKDLPTKEKPAEKKETPPNPAGGSTASSLLAQKRARRKNQDET